MLNPTRWTWAAALALCLLPLAAGAQPAPPASGTYIGATKCKNCHSKDHNGHQWNAWTKARHAGAFKVLATEAAKKVAAAKGIADAQKAPECLECHVLTHGLDKSRFSRSLAKLSEEKFNALGVQCEACHGPGEKHFKARFAAASDAPEEEGKVTPRQAVPAGEIGHVTLKTCQACHNKQSPTYKPFDCADRVAKILHLDPRNPRSKADAIKAVCGG